MYCYALIDGTVRVRDVNSSEEYPTIRDEWVHKANRSW